MVCGKAYLSSGRMMSKDKGSMPDWIGAAFAGILAVGSATGVYTTLASDMAVNKLEIDNIKKELILYREHSRETSKLIRDLMIKDALGDAESASLKKPKRLL